MSDDQYTYTYLCPEIAHKRIVPMVIEVRAHSLTEIGEMWNHVGEEFLYVLEGQIDLHTEFYKPSLLVAGNSAYFDSTISHAYIAVGDSPLHLLSCAQARRPISPKPCAKCFRSA